MLLGSTSSESRPELGPNAALRSSTSFWKAFGVVEGLGFGLVALSRYGIVVSPADSALIGFWERVISVAMIWSNRENGNDDLLVLVV